VLRAANAPLAPFDYRRTVEEIRDIVAGYARDAGGELDVGVVEAGLGAVESRLDAFYGTPVEAAAAQAFTVTQLRVGRRLVTLNYSQAGRFRQDPALQVPPLPELASARELAGTQDPHRRAVLRTELLRASNHVAYELREAARDLDTFLERRGTEPTPTA
jgi:hypothetical protein